MATPAFATGGVLTADEITRKRLIVGPSRPERLQPASYDLALGNEYRDNDGNIRELAGKQLEIPQFGVVVVSTEELINTDCYTVGRFDLMIRHALRGLILQVGTQVEPGYRGRLFGLILNLSSTSVVLLPGQSLFTIEFHRLTSAAEIKNTPPINTIRDFLIKLGTNDPIKSSLTHMREILSREVQERVSSEIEKHHAQWEQAKANRLVMWISFGVLLVTIFVGAALPLLVSKATLDKDDSFFAAQRQAAMSDVFDREHQLRDSVRFIEEHPAEFEALVQQLKSVGPVNTTVPKSTSPAPVKPGHQQSETQHAGVPGNQQPRN